MTDGAIPLHKIKVLLLAGGLGTRISSLFPSIPKPLIPFGEKTFLEHQIALFRSFGLSNFIVLAGPETKKFDDLFSRHEETIVLAESERTGTGGAIAHAVHSLKLSEPFIVANADTWWTGNLLPFFQRGLSTHEQTCLLVGKIKSVNESGKLKKEEMTEFYRFSEEENCQYCHTGLSWLRPELFPELRNCSLEKEIIRETAIHTWKGEYFDFGTPAGYEKLETVFKEQEKSKSFSSSAFDTFV